MIDEGLERLGLRFNPFRPYRQDDDDLSQITVGRDEEIGTLRTIVEFFSMQTRQNAMLVGASGVGKSTILFNLLNSIQDLDLQVVFHPFYPSLQDLVNSFAHSLGEPPEAGGARELGDRFIDLSNRSQQASKTLIILDNAEDFLGYDRKEEYIRVFKRSQPLFILAGTTAEWNAVVKQYPALSGIFTQLIVNPFDMERSKMLVSRRLALSQAKLGGYAPFTEEAVETISIYSLFVPGKLVDLSSRMIIEAIMEGRRDIPDDFVRQYIYDRSPFSEYYRQVNDRQVQILEEVIRNGGEASFNDLSDKIGISRVAIADHIQRLIDLGLVAHVEKPGKKKYFGLTTKLSTLV